MTEGTACRLSPLPGFSESIPLGEYRHYILHGRKSVEYLALLGFPEGWKAVRGHCEDCAGVELAGVGLVHAMD